MRGLVLILFVIVAVPAQAGPLRLKVRPVTGELIKTDRPCSKDVHGVLWKRVMRSFFIEVFEPDDDTDGTMVVSDDSGSRAADRFSTGEPFTGFFDQNTTLTFAIGVRDRFRKHKFVPVEIALIMRGSTTCVVKWLGSGERI